MPTNSFEPAKGIYKILTFCTNMNSGNRCEHFVSANETLNPITAGCEECKIEGTNWVALRMCLTCGHVGCCDSSVGLHATKHYKETSSSNGGTT